MKKCIGFLRWVKSAVFLGFLLLAGVMSGCGEKGTTDPPAPKRVITGDLNANIVAARVALENQDVPTAKTKFEDAHTLDPANKDANLGVALTSVIMLVEDPDVVNVIQRWDTYAPTVKNLLYGAVANTFEVYGGNNSYCGTEPAKNGYTKLVAGSTTSPFTYNGSYTYYLVFTSPFSQITLDAVTASSGNVNSTYGNPGNSYCRSGKVSGWDIGTNGDNKFIRLGGETVDGSVWGIKANTGSTSVKVYTNGAATPKAKAGGLAKAGTLSKMGTDSVDTDPMDKLNDLLARLPKNKNSLLQKARMASSIPATAPAVSEIQTVIDTKVLPVISDAITKLGALPGTGYTFTVTPAMTGNVSTTTTILDDGEFYAMDAGLSLLHALLNIMTAYNLDVDYKIVEADPLSIINGPSAGLTSSVDHTKFLTLKPTGTAKMTTALANLKNVAEKAKHCYIFVFDQWGYATTGTSTSLWPTKIVTDNGLEWHDPNNINGFLKSDDTDRRNDMDVALMALKGEVTHTKMVLNGSRMETFTDGATTITRSPDPTSSPNSTESIKVNITKFFTNPLDRRDLPTFRYDLPIDSVLSQQDQHKRPVNRVNSGGQVIYSQTWPTSDLPDKTLNGIFPDNIPGMDALIYLDKAVALDPSVQTSWSSSLASDGTSIYLYQSQYQSTRPSGTYWKIDPSTGATLSTTQLAFGYGQNNISSIHDITWHNGTLWASGYYYDASGSYHSGVFKIDGNSKALNPIPAPSSTYITDIASDGTNLFAGISPYGYGGGRAGIVKFSPSSLTIPSTPFVIETGSWPSSVGYGDGYLWVDDNDWKKVDPSTGAVIKKYWGCWGCDVYLQERLWKVEDQKLLSFIVP